MMVSVRKAKPLDSHTLWLKFSDGLEGEADISEYVWGPAFEPLGDPNYFARVRVSRLTGTVVWPNGADIAPETLYELAAATVASSPPKGDHKPKRSRKPAKSRRSGRARVSA